MHILILIYASIFAAVAVQGIREDLRFDAPLWKACLSTVAKALGVAGLLLATREDLEPALRIAWRYVFVLLVFEALIQLRFTYLQRFQRVLPEGEPGDAQLRSLILTSLLLGVAASAPYFWVNGALAFGGPS